MSSSSLEKPQALPSSVAAKSWGKTLFLEKDVAIVSIEKVAEAVSKFSKRLQMDAQEFETALRSVSSSKGAVFVDDSMEFCAKSEATFAFVDTGMDCQGKRLYVMLSKDKEFGFSGYFVSVMEKQVSNLANNYSSCHRGLTKLNPSEVAARFEKSYERAPKHEVEAMIEKLGWNKPAGAPNGGSEEKADVQETIKSMLANGATQAAVARATGLSPSTISRIKKAIKNEPPAAMSTAASAAMRSLVMSEVAQDLGYNPFKTDFGLERHVKIIGSRLGDLSASGELESVAVVSGQYAVVNTGLVDRYGNFMLVAYREDGRDFAPHKLVRSKHDALTLGFGKDDAVKLDTLAPISFFGEGERELPASIEDVDASTALLQHAIEDHYDRFDAVLKGISPEAIASKIKTDLEFGVARLSEDPTYAKPIWSSKVRKIAWLLPLRIRASLGQPPELVMLLMKCPETGFFVVKTVVPWDEREKDKTRSLSLFSAAW